MNATNVDDVRMWAFVVGFRNLLAGLATTRCALHPLCQPTEFPADPSPGPLDPAFTAEGDTMNNIGPQSLRRARIDQDSRDAFRAAPPDAAVFATPSVSHTSMHAADISRAGALLEVDDVGCA